jgi:hypothetical protein
VGSREGQWADYRRNLDDYHKKSRGRCAGSREQQKVDQKRGIGNDDRTKILEEGDSNEKLLECERGSQKVAYRLDRCMFMSANYPFRMQAGCWLTDSVLNRNIGVLHILSIQ